MPRKGDKAKPAAKPRATRAPSKRAKTTQQRRQAQPGYAATVQLRAQILELRTLGRTIPQIAEQVGRAVSTVHEHLTRALEELNAEQQEKAGQLQSLAYNRLERMLARAMLKAVTGDLKAMHDHVRDLIGDDAKRAAFSRAARDSVRERTWPAICAQLVQQYQAAIELGVRLPQG